MQMSTIDLQAVGMAVSACWVAPLRQMNRHKPAPYACTLSGLTVLASAAVSLQMTQVCVTVFLCTRPWFVGGTGTANMVNCLSVQLVLPSELHGILSGIVHDWDECTHTV